MPSDSKAPKPILSDQEINQYLARIKTSRERLPSIRWLRNLHRNHLLNIPFENLDIHLKNEIILDIKRVFEKVLVKRRGGFCYELNGLFYSLLQSLKFESHLIGAKVFDQGGSLGPELDHAAIIVYIDQNLYLCDVGFGDSFLTPKIIHPGEVQMDYNRYFRIDKDVDGNYTLLQSEDSVSFLPLYQFSKKKYELIEFIDMCHYHQHSPKSKFKKHKIITQAKSDGRMTLTDQKLTTHKLGIVEEQTILNHDEFCVLLRQHFGIEYR